MAISASEVLDALRPVRDPFLGASVVELGLVGQVKAGRRGVSVELRLPVSEYPPEELVARVRAALRPLDAAADVTVAVMADDERGALRAKLSGRESGNPFQDKANRTRVIGMSSGKGGVGKSSVTVNTAIALARLGHEVAILDADVYGFSVPKMLGIDEPPLVIDDVLVPPVAFGVKVISIGFFVEDDTPVIWRGPMLHKALEQFLVDVSWGEPDYLLVDMPPGTGDVALSMAQYLPKSEIYVITTPQAAAQRVAQRTAYAARKLNLQCRGVIENMSWFTGDDGKRYELFGAGGGGQLAEQLGVPLLGQVPLVAALREGGDVGMPVTVADPAGEASQAFDELAKRIDDLGPGRIYKPELSIS